MDHAQLLNLLAYSTQVAVIVLLGCALPALLRLDVPGVRFVYWRVLTVLCLTLPWLQHRQILDAAVSPESTTVAPLASLPSAATSTALAAVPPINWPVLIGLLLAAGVVVRLLWMGAGLFYLRRLRSAGSGMPASEDLDELQRALGTRASVRYVAALRQPVTFGMFRPVVLLPDGLRAQAPDIQRAVLAHELVHVRRHDWAWIIGEELVRAALWFHPAMWWLISRVQLAREEVVDEIAVTVTGRRRTYVEALLAFADSTPLAPAPAFARRRHLFRRMTLISTEAVMSSRRVVMSCATMALVVAGGSWYAVGAFPMQQAVSGVVMSDKPGPLEKAAKPVTPENPIPRRLVSFQPDYPPEIAGSGARGTVAVRITLDETGRVAEVRPLGLTATATSPKFTIEVNNVGPNQWEGFVHTAANAETAKVLRALVDAAAAGVQRWSYEPPAEAPVSFDVSFRFAPDTETTSAQLAAPPQTRDLTRSAAANSTDWSVDGALRIGGDIKAPVRIRDARPVYPPEALAARVTGVVIVEARVGPDGWVTNARVLRSIPMLDQAALDAVMQWKFTPTLLNGQAVPVIMTMTVNFTLR